MKRAVLALLALFLLLSVGSAMATTITFDEAPLYGSDPAIGKVTFSAGAASAFNDTFVADFWTPGNAYLMSGRNDGTGLGNMFGGYFLAAAIASPSRFKSVTLDLAVEEQLPGSPVEVFYFFGRPGAWSGATTYISDTDYHTLTLNNYGDADFFGVLSLNFWDKDANYSAFHIDNFSYNEAGAPVPEPSTFLLLGAGIVGCVAWRRRKA